MSWGLRGSGYVMSWSLRGSGYVIPGDLRELVMSPRGVGVWVGFVTLALSPNVVEWGWMSPRGI